MDSKTIRRGATTTALVAVAAIAATAAIAGAPATQHFILTNSERVGSGAPSAVVFHVRAAGPIAGKGSGSLRTFPAGGRVDQLTLRFATGTVAIVATDTRSVVRPDMAACKARLSGAGTYRITGGTGSFRGASGTGTYDRTGVLIGARTAAGTCLGQSAKPRASYVTVTMTGTAALGA